MEQWNGDQGWNGDVLWRIVALLVSLAGLADAAAGLPARRRREVLGFLMPGEAAARALIAGMAPGAPDMADEPWPCDRASDDAALLAATFRVLALALYTMLSLADRPALPGAAVRTGRAMPNGRAGNFPLANAVASRFVPPDTS